MARFRRSSSRRSSRPARSRIWVGHDLDFGMDTAEAVGSATLTDLDELVTQGVSPDATILRVVGNFQFNIIKLTAGTDWAAADGYWGLILADDSCPSPLITNYEWMAWGAFNVFLPHIEVPVWNGGAIVSGNGADPGAWSAVERWHNFSSKAMRRMSNPARQRLFFGAVVNNVAGDWGNAEVRVRGGLRTLVAE